MYDASIEIGSYLSLKPTLDRFSRRSRLSLLVYFSIEIDFVRISCLVLSFYLESSLGDFTYDQ